MVSRIRIDVVSSEGVLLLGETHSIRFGTEGLLGVPERLEVNSSSMLCFPTKDGAGDNTNRGNPFTAICGIFSPWGGLQIKSAMLSNGYFVSEDGKAHLWIRAERNTNHRVRQVLLARRISLPKKNLLLKLLASTYLRK